MGTWRISGWKEVNSNKNAFLGDYSLLLMGWRCNIEKICLTRLGGSEDRSKLQSFRFFEDCQVEIACSKIQKDEGTM